MSPVTPPPSASERRRFLKLVGVAGLTSAVHGSLAGWATAATAPAAARPAAAPAKPDSVAVAPPAVPAEISEDARTLTTVLERRYGKLLSPKQLEAVTRELENRIQAGKRLRESKLANHDEPDVVFSA